MKKNVLLLLLALCISPAFAQVCFSPTGVNLTTGPTPLGSVTGDWNNDGKKDIATASNSSGFISVALGNGNGTFGANVNYAASGQPVDLTAADFNQDGNQDLAYVVTGGGLVNVLMGSASGTFATAINYTVAGGSSNMGIVAADFNSDGKPDIAITSSPGSNIYVLLNSGTGTFNTGVAYFSGSNSYGITSADFNGDGNKDLAVTNQATSNNVAILLGSPTGTFGAPVTYFVGTTPYDILAVDFNADGKQDLAVTNYGSNNVSILIGSGTGTFAAAVNYAVAGTPVSITSGDFNNDAKPDLVTANQNNNSVSVLLNTGSGAFSAASTFTGVQNAASVVSANFNADGYSDIGAVSTYSNNIVLLLRTVISLTASNPTTCPSYNSTLTASGASTYTWSNGATTFSTVVNPFSTTTYTINAKNASACTTTAAITITVNPNPSAGGTSNYPACTGSPINFTNTSTGAATYSWSGPGGFNSTLQNPSIVSASTGNTGTYTITAITSLGCTATTTLIVNVNVSPTVVVSVTNGTYCAGGSATLNASGATSYSWSTGGTTSGITVSPATNTSYTVTGTDAIGCPSVTTTTVVVNPNPTITVNSGSVCAGSSFTMNVAGASTYTFSSGSNIVTPIASTDYSVTGTSAQGCISASAAVSSVTVNAHPTVSVNSGSICNGSSFTVTPSGASTYTITGNNFTVSPTANTDYSITGTSAQGCISTNTAVSSVTVNAIPVISANSGTLCSGNSFTVIPSGASTYTITGGNFIVSPAANTDYSVTGTSAQGCVSTNTAVSSLTVYATPVLGVNSGSICSGNSFTVTPSGASTYTITGGTFIVNPLTSTDYSVTGTSALGCAASNTAVSSVTVSATPAITVNNGTICVGQSFTVNATGASTYTWNTVPNTPSIVVNPLSTTSYTVVGSSAANCTSTAVQTLVVNALPNVTLAITSAVVCSGQTTTLTAFGANTYTFEPGTVVSQSNVAMPLVTTVYTVTGESLAGCTNTAVISVSVNPTPTLNLTSTSQSLCAGAMATLTPGGADTYTLNPGNITGTTFTVSPNATTQYSLNGLTNAGCFDAADATITINVNALTAISGAITTAPSVPVTGTVNLYEYKPFLTSFNLIATQAIAGNGSYTFATVAPGVYIVQANPASNTLQVTYGNSSVSWQTATTFTHDCIAGATQNVDVIPIDDQGGGTGSLSGTIREGNGFQQKSSGVLTPGNPIGGIIVKGGRNPGGNTASQGRTNPQGEYVLTNLRTNSVNESYFIIVDIPGLDTTHTYHRIIITGSENFDHLDFTVDSAHIVPAEDLTVGMREVLVENGILQVYPNPADNNVTIKCELKKSAAVKIELIDITGRTVKTLLPESNEAEGQLQVIAGIHDVKQGIYFVKMKVDNEERTTKIVITH